MPALMPLRLNVFPGGFNWPSFVAQDKGFFAQNGLDVAILPTPNSIAQMTELSRGDFELAMTAVDNIVAYVEGQGEAPIGAQPDFVAVMGSDNGFLRLVAAPDIAATAALRGRTVSVDALTTGYAFVLLEALRLAGLTANDYRIESAGGMVQRWTAMQDGRQQATMLSAPYNLLAKAKGYNQLGTATEILGAYQGNVLATRRSWARDNVEAVRGFVRAYRAALRWLYDEANRAESLAILTRHVPAISGDLATATYDELLGPDGFAHDAAVDEAGFATVVRLRERYAREPKPLGPLARYYDPSFYDAVAADER